MICICYHHRGPHQQIARLLTLIEQLKLEELAMYIYLDEDDPDLQDTHDYLESTTSVTPEVHAVIGPAGVDSVGVVNEMHSLDRDFASNICYSTDCARSVATFLFTYQTGTKYPVN
jgi:hypothetical protein